MGFFLTTEQIFFGVFLISFPLMIKKKGETQRKKKTLGEAEPLTSGLNSQESILKRPNLKSFSDGWNQSIKGWS